MVLEQLGFISGFRGVVRTKAGMRLSCCTMLTETALAKSVTRVTSIKIKIQDFIASYIKLFYLLYVIHSHSTLVTIIDTNSKHFNIPGQCYLEANAVQRGSQACTTPRPRIMFTHSYRFSVAAVYRYGNIASLQG